MDLVLWRHAEAEEGADDAQRRLTRKGLKHAERMAAWLHQRLPQNAQIIVSPAERARQTAKPLPRHISVSAQVDTGAQAADILKAAGWPRGTGTVVIVGHQPGLGAAAALALTGKAASWRMKKGAVWWLSSGGRDGVPLLVAVMAPELL